MARRGGLLVSACCDGHSLGPACHRRCGADRQGQPLFFLLSRLSRIDVVGTRVRRCGSNVSEPFCCDCPNQGVHISDLLTDYAMALLREMGLNPDGTQRAPRTLPSAATSGSAAGTGLYTNVSSPTAAVAAAAAAAPTYYAPAPEPVPEPVAQPEPAYEEPKVNTRTYCAPSHVPVAASLRPRCPLPCVRAG